ncbi:MAG: helix-turn-helix transcriptional regulator [Opitutaceae bacterium]
MLRFSSAQFARTHRVLLEIHAARSVGELRRIVPFGLKKLIGCDRAATNEFRYDANSLVLTTPSPKPAYWDRLGSVFAQHYSEHYIVDAKKAPARHRPTTFGDFPQISSWQKSPLYNEYYLPVGAKRQIVALAVRTKFNRLALNCNRWGRDFSAADRAVMEIFSRHVAQAWVNAARLAAWNDALNDIAPSNQTRGLLMLDADNRVLGPVPESSRQLARRYFSASFEEKRPLPDALRRWLLACLQMRHRPDAICDEAPPLTIRNEDRVLTVRLARADFATTTLLLDEQLSLTANLPALLSVLTPREREVLSWLAEGKRNAEISSILDMSPRTVGKHVEHLLEKLKVETRAGAVRAALDFELHAHAKPDCK